MRDLIHRHSAIKVFMILLVLACGRRAPAQVIKRMTTPELPQLLESDPDLTFNAPAELFPTGLREVWGLALAHDEADVRQLAARSIVIANRGGKTDWEPLHALLIKNLSDERRLVRMATVEAVIELDLKEVAATLAKLSDQDGLEMSQLVEPALARWGYSPRTAVWLSWLESPAENQGLAKIAMTALAETKHQEAIKTLEALVLNSSKTSLRVAAARALGRLAEKNLEESAATLAAKSGNGAQAIPRILAAVMLRSHTSVASHKLLTKLLRDEQAAVLNAAAESILPQQPQAIVGQTEHILRHGDANTRRLLADALSREPSDMTLPLLADRLDDVNPTVRTTARSHLLELVGNDQFRDKIVKEVRRMLSDGGWQGCEQAAHLTVALKDVESGPRLLELLEHPRPEVFVTAAWALSHVNPPDGHKQALGLCEERLATLKGDEHRPFEVAYVLQAGHLVQWFSIARYQGAEPFMRRCVPKFAEPDFVRRAAVWGLGYLYEDKPLPELRKQLFQRMEDTESQQPEDDLVRQACAICLGRMKDPDAVAKLERWLEIETVLADVGAACAWSLHRINGTPIPEVEPTPSFQSGFFLERITRSKE